MVDATASLVRRVLMDDCSGDTVTMCGYSAAAFGTSGWRLQWRTVGEPSTDTPARPDTLAGFTIRRTLLELERHEHQPLPTGMLLICQLFLIVLWICAQP